MKSKADVSWASLDFTQTIGMPSELTSGIWEEAQKTHGIKKNYQT
jgi:hypothetical protein